MLPFLLSVSIVVFWAVVGRALLAAVNFRVGVLRSWLLAPAVGFSVQVVTVAVLNQAGLPVKDFAWPLALVCLAAAVAVLAWRRPVFPLRHLAPYFVIGLAFLAWAGSPMFKFGFNWVSYVNDDYTNYCLSAERFKDFGFYHPATLADLKGLDYRQYYFVMHALALMRSGSEHAIAFVASLTGLNSLRIFMALILAMAVAQIGAAAGLVLHFGRWRRAAGLTALLLAASPLFIFGALYQLISQVGGVALMLAVLALLTARMPRGRLRLLGGAVPTAVAGAAVALVYPEISPFAVLAYLLFAGIEWLRRRRFPAARVVFLEYTLLVWIALLRFNVVSYLYTLANQFVSGMVHQDLSLSLFPFFLIPSGLASLFGFQPINGRIPEPWGSILICLGLVLLAAAVVREIFQAWKPAPMAVLFLVQFGLGVRLFQGGDDFGLYKLAMFIQPALFAGLAGVLCVVLRRRLAVAAGAAALIALMTPSGLDYIAASQGSTANGLTEMQHASQDLPRRPAPEPGAYWGSGIDNVVAAKMAANFYAGTDIHFLARDFFHAITFLVRPDWPGMRFYPHPQLYTLGTKLLAERNSRVFVPGTLFGSPFVFEESDRQPSAYLELPSHLSLFNKFEGRRDQGRLFDLIPADAVRNRLVFVHSKLGNHYYLGTRSRISFYQQEGDPYRPGGSINGIGKFFLLRVEHPTGPIYLRLAATKTIMGPDNKRWSPAAVVEGRRTIPMGLLGGGAVNRFIGPIEPVPYRGADYIALDFGQEPLAFPIVRHGVAGWYNREVPLDYRRLVAFGRDISVISAAEYRRLPRPRRVSRFPDDLIDAAGLEFSGICEDGWLSPDSEFVLGPVHPGESLHLEGVVPSLPGTPEMTGTLTVKVNGRPAATLASGIGLFDWMIPIAEPGRTTHVRLHFSASGILPAPDSREVSAKLRLLEIAPGPSRIDLSGSALETSPTRGIDGDGWAARASSVWLPAAPGAARIVLDVQYPGWSGIAKTSDVAVGIAGGALRRYALKPGLNRIVLDAPAASGERQVVLRAAGTFRLPAPDGRERAFRILSVETLPSAAGGQAAVAPGAK